MPDAYPNKRKPILISLFALLAWSLVVWTQADASSREEVAFVADWRMHVGDPAGAEQPTFDDSGWARVTLPRAFNEDDAFRVDIHDLPTGVVWYRKRFTVAAMEEGGRAFFEFEGVRQAGDVYINGALAGSSENGVMAFGVDATRLLRPAQENVIAVRVDNSWTYAERASGARFQWNNSNFNATYGGIPRPVRLILTGPLYQTLPLYSSLGTTGVYIWADAFDIPRRMATVHAQSEIHNASTAPRTFRYRVIVRDARGRRVGRFTSAARTLGPGETGMATASGRLRGLNFWSWGYGYLYTVSTEVVVDGDVIDRVDTRTGFRKTAFENGAFSLNDRVMHLHGYAQRTSNEWPALGVDVPPWLSDFSNALMVESGANLVRWMHVAPSRQDAASADRVGLLQAMPAGDAESDASGRQWEQRIELMRDAIVYHRNNPSIVFYESGNKGVSEDHMAQMRALRDRFDPHGGRAIGSRDMLGSATAEYGGEMLYINKSAGIPLWQHEYSRDEGARLYQDAFTPPFHADSPDYNRNQDSHAIENVRRWYDYWRERPGSGRRVNAGGVNIIFSDSNTHFRGDNNYRRSGEVDAMRLPKEGFYAHQVMWDGWVDVERRRTHIIGHWNYAADVVKDIFVVSSADSVELFLNGGSLGQGRREYNFLFTFDDIAYAPGSLRAVGYDSEGHQVSTHELVTAGPARALRLRPQTSPVGWRADGVDVALVDVEVVDEQGRRVPTAVDMVHFSVEGPAEWRGGIAQGRPDNFILSRDLPVEGGINRILLRATETPGRVVVTARAENLQSAMLELDVAPAPGTVTALHGDDLPSDLDRGPTPLGPSFQMWRTPIDVAAVSAGSAPDAAALSYDDNEATRWNSDGDVANGWIEYQLDGAHALGELTLKLTGWRLRIYPIRISVDGRTVFEGEAPRSLGYITLPLGGVVGSRLRIALTGPTSDRDAFGRIVEVNNDRAAMSTGADRVPSGGVLSIVEAEIYAPH